MKIGYARTGTADQPGEMDTQLALLRRAGCEKLFSEKVSSTAKRERLEAALDLCRGNDTLVIARLDRLARSVGELVRLTDRLRQRGAHLCVLDPGIDTGTATGRLAVTMFGAVARFQHEIALERQREGIARAKADGRYKGRVPTARRQAGEIVALRQQGLKAEQIAERLGIGRSSVFRVIKEQREAGRAAP